MHRDKDFNTFSLSVSQAVAHAKLQSQVCNEVLTCDTVNSISPTLSYDCSSSILFGRLR